MRVRARYFSFLQNSRPAVRPTQPPIEWVKGTGRDINHSPPSSAEVKNERSYTCVPPICLRGVDKENFTFTF